MKTEAMIMDRSRRDKWVRLAAILLDQAADRYGNDICNDWEFPDEWTREDRELAVQEYHEWNGDPEEVEPGEDSLPNFCAMFFAASVLIDGYDQPGDDTREELK